MHCSTHKDFKNTFCQPSQVLFVSDRKMAYLKYLCWHTYLEVSVHVLLKCHYGLSKYVCGPFILFQKIDKTTRPRARAIFSSVHHYILFITYYIHPPLPIQRIEFYLLNSLVPSVIYYRNINFSSSCMYYYHFHTLYIYFLTLYIPVWNLRTTLFVIYVMIKF